MEANGYGGRYQFATRCTQFYSAFVGYVISKVRHLNIQSNKIILIIFQNITKICTKGLYFKSSGKMTITLSQSSILQHILIKIEYREKFRIEWVRIYVQGLVTIHPFLVSVIIVKKIIQS